MRKTIGIVVCLVAVLCAPAIAGDDTRYRLSVHADAHERDRLSEGGFDVAGHDLANDRVEVLADAVDLERLRVEGFVYDIVEVRDGPRPLGAGELDVPLPDQKYTDPAEMEVFLQQTHADHPDITRLVDLGTTHEGRTIWGMLISDNAAVDEDELSILLNGAHHAREVMTPEIIRDAIEYLTDGYATDPAIAARVDAYEIWCVPMVNPDGVARVFEVDDFWRKNLRDNDANQIINGNDGVDLNRNYEWGWGYQCRGSSSAIGNTTYRGPWEGSEPEPQAMLNLGRRVRPVFDVEFHSYGGDVFYAMSCDPQFNPRLSTIADANKDISRVIAEGYAAEIIAADGTPGFFAAPYGGRVDGTGRDGQYHENGSIAFVTEVNNSSEGGFHPDYDTYRDVTVEGQRPGWLWLIDRISGPAIGGHVLDAVTGLPVAADIALDELTLPDGKRLTTRADTGRFHVIVVVGNYTLRVSAPGYVDAAVPLSVGPAWAPVEVALVPTGSSVLVTETFEEIGGPAGWSAGVAGDTATQGGWEHAEPHGTHFGDVVLANLTFGAPRLDATPGQNVHAFVTGHLLSSDLDDADIDGGYTTLASPSFDLTGYFGTEVSWHRWFRKEPLDADDWMTAEVSVNGGSNWIELERLDANTTNGTADPSWMPVSYRLEDFVSPGADVRFRFRAQDGGVETVVEAAVDDFEIRGYDLVTQGRVPGVRVDGVAATVVSWDAVPGASSATYDVERGDLGALSGGGGGVSLGPLQCVVNDIVAQSTVGDEDTDTPAPGAAYFYLVRFRTGAGEGDLGTGSDGGIRQGTGGCN